MDRQPFGPVFVGIALILDLLQGLAFGGEFNDLEFEQVDLLVEPDGHVEAAVVAGIFQGDVETEGGEVAVEDAGVIALVLGNGILAVPVMRNTCEQLAEVGLQSGEVIGLQAVIKAALGPLGRNGPAVPSVIS